MGDESKGGRGEVLRLRNLAMIENIRRAHDPAWRERLEQQQLLARLGRMFGRAEDPLQALQDHADALKAELHTSRNGSRSRVAETARPMMRVLAGLIGLLTDLTAAVVKMMPDPVRRPPGRPPQEPIIIKIPPSVPEAPESGPSDEEEAEIRRPPGIAPEMPPPPRPEERTA